MKYWKSILFVTLCSIALVLACTPEAEKSTDKENDADKQGESSVGILPRNIDDYALGDTFDPGDTFQVDENAAKFMFNEVEGVTYKSIPDPEAGEGQPVITICTIGDRIFKIKKTTPMEFSEADSFLARHLTMYGKALDRENRPDSETDMHWMNFFDGKTAMRLEFLVRTLNTEISAFDLKP
jgi:hypothetical protein